MQRVSRVNGVLTRIVNSIMILCRELCENGWTNQEAVWNAESGWSR